MKFDLFQYKLTTLIFLIFVLSITFSSAQNDVKFCRVVENGNFKKTERFVKKLVRKFRNGKQFDNGPGSGMQTTFTQSFDSITTRINSQHCIEDAFWDMCQDKISIYPGFSTIGVRMKTKSGITEKCYTIQEGTTGYVRIFSWRLNLFKSRMKLFYHTMRDCGRFCKAAKN
jgi:hypothetical protein